MKIVILNDLHPAEQAGAAGIAIRHAILLAQNHEVEFWSASSSSATDGLEASIRFRFAYHLISERGMHFQSQIARIFLEFINIRQSFWLVNTLRVAKPDLVWMHQIGNRFPKTTPVICYLLGIKTIQTHHDYSLVTAGKLYPQNLQLNDEMLSCLHDLPFGDRIDIVSRLKLDPRRYMQILLTIRRFLLVKISYLNYRNVTIGRQQTSIFSNLGVRNLVHIPNSTADCDCKNPRKKIHGQLVFLFAGRPLGKGLDRICSIVRNSQNCKLLIAGEKSVLSYLPDGFDQSKYEYLGELSQAELFNTIHGVDYVSVLSTCLDVYPSILLEALRHGSRVISTTSVGNCTLIKTEFDGYLLPYSFNFEVSNFDDLKAGSISLPVKDLNNRMFDDLEVMKKINEITFE